MNKPPTPSGPTTRAQQAEARRCVNAISDYLRSRDESPRAAADLLNAVKVLEDAAALRSSSGVIEELEQLKEEIIGQSRYPLGGLSADAIIELIDNRLAVLLRAQQEQE